MVFAAGCVFSSVSKHGPHKSCTLSLNKSLTVREKPASCGHFPILALVSRGLGRHFSDSSALARSFQLLCSLAGSSTSPLVANRHAFVCIAIFSPFWGGGREGPVVPRVGRFDAQPVSPVEQMPDKVTPLGMKRVSKSES